MVNPGVRAELRKMRTYTEYDTFWKTEWAAPEALNLWPQMVTGDEVDKLPMFARQHAYPTETTTTTATAIENSSTT